MRAEHICEWMVAATWEEYQYKANWETVVGVVHIAFIEGRLPVECT